MSKNSPKICLTSLFSYNIIYSDIIHEAYNTLKHVSSCCMHIRKDFVTANQIKLSPVKKISILIQTKLQALELELDNLN